MSEGHEPAWKRAGLVKQEKGKVESYNPLESGLKRTADPSKALGPKKPPKRPKLPKSQRPPPPERDQLAYLRAFHESRETWKFSKQKQNWILRNIFEIDAKYDEALMAYLAGLQGGSRDRVCDLARQKAQRWNEFMSAKDADSDEGSAGQSESEGESASEKEPKPEAQPDAQPAGEAPPAKQPRPVRKTQQQRIEEARNAPPTEAQARRAKAIVELLSNETVSLEYLD